MMHRRTFGSSLALGAAVSLLPRLAPAQDDAGAGKAASARNVVLPRGLFAARSKHSFHAVSTDDRTINPDLERFMARRIGAGTIEIQSSHLSLISIRRRWPI